MGRYDTVRCAQIRNLIEENQYLAAMEEIEEMDFEKIPTISDLYLFADVFLKAEKMDAAKELYYTAYKRTASRPALYRLLMLVIRMGDVEEARELYLAYEIVAGMTLDTYELRYRLAKAEGQPRSALIEILEQLKKSEYTEEWGLQLAKLYEMEGQREKCIKECEDMKRWFGTGTIVKKAEELMRRCMSPAWVRPADDEIPEPEVPDLEEEIKQVAYAPVHVEEIRTEKPSVPEKTEEPSVSEKMVVETEVLVSEEPAAAEAELPDPEQIEEQAVETSAAWTESPVPEKTEEPAASEAEQPDPVKVEEAEEETAKDMQEEDENSSSETAGKTGFLKRIVNYFKVDMDFFEEDNEFPEELDTYKQQSTAEINVKAIVAENVDEILEEVPEPSVESLDDKLQEVAEEQQKVIRLDDTMNLEPVVNKETEMNLEDTMNVQAELNKESAQVKSHPLGNTASMPDIVEDVSKNGIHYNTLKGVIYKIHREERVINIALTGGAPGISLAVAKKLFKELKKINYFEAKNMGKIEADKLNKVNLEEWIEKFIGGCMYIMDAPSLSNQTVANLNALIEKYQKQIVIILEGSYDEMDSFLNYHKEFEKKISYKVKL